MPILIGATGLNFSSAPTQLTLAGAQAYLIPSGQYLASTGLYTAIEWYDSNAGLWRVVNWNGTSRYILSDGTNWRLINRTGCPVGAVVTNKGSAYTSAPAVAVSAGGSVWKAIVGGSINTTVTVTTAGLYNYVPTLIFSPPPAGGITASGIAVLSAGAINSVTVTNAGAGYVTAPTVTIVPDPRETAAGGGVLTVNTTLANSGSITGVVCTDPGTAAVTTLPTLTFSGGGGASAAATVMMNWTVTGITVGTAGAAYGNAQPFLIESGSFLNTATATNTIPAIEKNIAFGRPFYGEGVSTAGGATTATGFVISDAGYGFQNVPNLFVTASGTAALPTTTAIITATVGATTDTSYLQTIRL